MQIRKRRKELLVKDSHSQTDEERQQAIKQIQAYKTTVGKGALTVEDLKRAEHEIIRFCQKQSFQEQVNREIALSLDFNYGEFAPLCGEVFG